MGDPDKHFDLGPSSAHRWLECPGSVEAIKAMPTPPESPYAAEGTAAHALAEKCLTNNQMAGVYIDNVIENIEITKEMSDYVQEYVNYVRSLGGVQEYEQVISYDKWVPGGFGTADTIVTVDDVLYVIDLKYGKGVKVDAEDNPQGMIYALGALNERDVFQKFKKVVIVIHQPRLNHVSEWEITPKSLYKWAETLKKKAKLCRKPDAPRVSGEKQCKFCEAKPVCPALLERTQSVVMKEFDDITDGIELSSTDQLTDKQLSYIMDNKKLITDWLKSVEDYVKGQITSGNEFPGWKLVHGRGTRRWSDEKQAEVALKSLLGDAAYNKKLLSVAQAEKALGKEDKGKIKNLITKPDGAPTLAPESDKREPITFVTADDF